MAVAGGAARRRASRKEAWKGQLAAARPADELSVDPLDREQDQRRSSDLVVLAPILLLAAVGAHVVFTAIIWAAGSLLGADAPTERDERIEVRVIEPAPEPEKVEPPEPEKVEPPEPEKIEPAPRPRPKAEPPPEPPPETPPPPPRKIVGLDMGSTTTGGSGPSFATGDSLAGKTDDVARGPVDDPPAEKTTPPPPGPTNRKATRIAPAGVETVKPRRLSRVEPVYPAKLRAQGVEGNVLVEVRLDASGAVVAARVVEGSDYDEMNQAALAAARKERFSPATRDGKAMPFTLTYTIRFRLTDL